MYGTNITRISGIASGMDTESLVKKLMDAERIPVNKLKQNREKLGWQSDAYRKWNTDIFSFRTKTLFDMKMSKTYGTFNVSSSESDKVTGAATADAVPGTYKIKVNQIAEGATFTGVPSVSTTDKLVTNPGGFTFSVTVNGKKSDITIDTDDTINDLVSKLNTATFTENGKTLSLGVQAMYDPALNQLIVKTKNTGSGQELKFSASDTTGLSNLLDKVGIKQKPLVSLTTDPNAKLNTAVSGELILKVSGKPDETISFGAGSTVKTVIDEFSKRGLNVLFDENTHLFSISSDDPSVTSISIESKNTDDDFSAIGLAATEKKDSVQAYTAIGKDALVTFNGTDVRTSSNTATFFGVNYTFKDKETTEVTLTVTRDLDAQIKNIKDFIDKYNEILEKLNKTIDEPVYKQYQPLTDEERKALSEKQIEQWEEKAKSGLLRRDGTLSSLVMKMRTSMMATVDNGSIYNSLSAIGIKSENYKDKGKLTVDEDKLRKALQEDPEAVKNLFIQGSDITAEDVKNDPTKQGQRGLIHRLNDDFSEAFTAISKKAGVSGNAQDDQSVIGKMLQDIDKRINRMEDRLIDKENRYYKQFTAMEKAMSQYNSQGAWLAQQFGGGR